jgi:hypothetical protein
MSNKSNYAEVVRLLETAPIRFFACAKYPREKHGIVVCRGLLELPDGEQRHVLIRSQHRPLEVKVAKFHELTPFTCTVAKTASRSLSSLDPEFATVLSKVAYYRAVTAVDIQEYLGETLDDPLVERHLSVVSDQLRDQLEQATAERVIIGDQDDHVGNLTVSELDGAWTIGNIDFHDNGYIEGAFNTEKVPVTRLPHAGRTISPDTLDKIEALILRLESSEGRNHLSAIGLSPKQSEALVLRARFLAEQRRFPGHVRPNGTPDYSPPLLAAIYVNSVRDPAFWFAPSASAPVETSGSTLS